MLPVNDGTPTDAGEQEYVGRHYASPPPPAYPRGDEDASTPTSPMTPTSPTSPTPTSPTTPWASTQGQLGDPHAPYLSGPRQGASTPGAGCLRVAIGLFVGLGVLTILFVVLVFVAVRP